MVKKRIDERTTPFQNFIAGAASGIIARTLTSPLDVVKILCQIGAPETTHGLFRSFVNVYRSSGLKGFWKGNLIACLRLVPYNGLLFSFYHKLKVMWCEPSTGQLSSPKSFTAGALAGIGSSLLLYPLDMLKTRLTVDRGHISELKYRNSIKYAVKTIIKEEGFLALYKGALTTTLGVIPFTGCLFMCYEILEYTWGRPSSEMGPLQHFINGALAAAFAQTFSLPLDTIRKKMQAQSPTVRSIMKPDVEFEGTLGAFRQTVRKFGILGLWRGQAANLLKVAPHAGIMFLIFEQIRLFYVWNNGYIVSPFRDIPRPGVNQYLTPEEVKELYRQHWAESIRKSRGE